MVPSLSHFTRTVVNMLSSNSIRIPRAHLSSATFPAAASVALLQPPVAVVEAAAAAVVSDSKRPCERALPITGSSRIRYGLDGGSAHHRTESCKGNEKKKGKKKEKKKKKRKREQEGKTQKS